MAAIRVFLWVEDDENPTFMLLTLEINKNLKPLAFVGRSMFQVHQKDSAATSWFMCVNGKVWSSIILGFNGYDLAYKVTESHFWTQATSKKHYLLSGPSG